MACRIFEVLDSCVAGLLYFKMSGMIITVASFKGGVGKTVTAVHLTAYLQRHGSTVLVDGDPNRSSTGWMSRGELPFKVVDERQAVKFARDYEHIVIDTAARPDSEELNTLADGCDLLILPTTPDALSLDALILTVNELAQIGRSDGYRILLTMLPPKPSRDGQQARSTLEENGFPVFASEIRRLVAFQKAALTGSPVYEVKDPRAQAAWDDYVQVGEEVFRSAGQ